MPKCLYCGKSFRATKANQVYCTSQHGDYYRKVMHGLKKSKNPVSIRKCSCGCGRPVGKGKRFLSDTCFRTADEKPFLT